MWSKYILERIYPGRCLLCAADLQHPGDSAALCPDCHAELPRNKHACPGCALPVTGGTTAVCGGCQRHPPHFDRAIAAFSYLSPLDHLLGRFKHAGNLTHGRLLAELLAGHLERVGPPLPEVILPTPIHPARLRLRGFAQCTELARHLSKKMGIPWDGEALTKQRPTPPQQGLDRAARRRNVRGSFACTRDLPWRHVAVVDDVITTGSTADEMARVLRRAGVHEISIWAVARTPDTH